METLTTQDDKTRASYEERWADRGFTIAQIDGLHKLADRYQVITGVTLTEALTVIDEQAVIAAGGLVLGEVANLMCYGVKPVE